MLAWLANRFRVAREDYAPRLSRHIPALDGLRGVAILMVTLFRFGQSHQPAESALDAAILRIFGQGFRGVDLFFVLSGFLITGILHDTKSSPRYFVDFFTRRSLRIFPLYYAVLLVFALTTWLAPAWIVGTTFEPAAERQVWLWLYGTNVLQAWTDSWCFGPFNHFWSLAVEEHFYLVWPFVIWALTRRQAMVASLGLSAAALALRVHLARQGFDVAAETLAPCRLDALCLGAWLALWLRGPSKPEVVRASIGAATFVSGAALLAMFALSKRWLTIGDSLFAVFSVGCVFAAVDATPGSIAGRILDKPWLKALGTYSYAMYMFQAILLYLTPAVLSPDAIGATKGSRLAGRLAYVVGMFAVSLALATLSHRFLERPFLRLKDVWAPKR